MKLLDKHNIKFLVCLHGEYNILVKLCGNTNINLHGVSTKLNKYKHNIDLSDTDSDCDEELIQTTLKFCKFLV